jgi:prefoldin subunit 5
MNLDSDLAELKRALTQTQDELTQLSRPIGYKEEQAAAALTKAQV